MSCIWMYLIRYNVFGCISLSDIIIRMYLIIRYHAFGCISLSDIMYSDVSHYPISCIRVYLIIRYHVFGCISLSDIMYSDALCVFQKIQTDNRCNVRADRHPVRDQTSLNKEVTQCRGLRAGATQGPAVRGPRGPLLRHCHLSP